MAFYTNVGLLPTFELKFCHNDTHTNINTKAMKFIVWSIKDFDDAFVPIHLQNNMCTL